MRRAPFVVILALATLSVPVHSRVAAQSAPAPGHLGDPFAPGWMIVDTNGDGVADAVVGAVVVPDAPTAADNAAAADVAARLAFGSTGLTLPLVVRAGDAARAAPGPRFFVGAAAAPASIRSQIEPLVALLTANEGGVFAAGADLVLAGKDAAGLQAAAEAYCARAPYQWALKGDALSSIAPAINKALESGRANTTAELVGVTYVKGTPGIRRAMLRTSSAVAAPALTAALKPVRLAAVHEVVVVGGPRPLSVTNPDAIASEPAAPPRTLEPRPLDLADLYTIKGLLGGSDRMPVPASVDGRLYVPGGTAGVAMANLAARLALESTGVTLPIAVPADGVKPGDVATQAVVAGESPLGAEVERRLHDEDTSHLAAKPLAAGEGELRVVDEALAKHDALLLRGDEQGMAAAAALAAGHFPNLWDYGKPYLSLGDIRTDLHRFFSERSSAGQATAALYHLDRWMTDLSASGGAVSHVEAEVYVDLADPGLGRFVQQEVDRRLHVSGATVRTGSLHAGTQCCDHGVSLGYQSPRVLSPGAADLHRRHRDPVGRHPAAGRRAGRAPPGPARRRGHARGAGERRSGGAPETARADRGAADQGRRRPPAAGGRRAVCVQARVQLAGGRRRAGAGGQGRREAAHLFCAEHRSGSHERDQLEGAMGAGAVSGGRDSRPDARDPARRHHDRGDAGAGAGRSDRRLAADVSRVRNRRGRPRDPDARLHRDDPRARVQRHVPALRPRRGGDRLGAPHRGSQDAARSAHRDGH